MPERIVFDKLVQVLVFGCAYHRIADAMVLATTLRRGRDKWIAAWTSAHNKLVWCTERRATVVAFWISLSTAILILGRLVREGWTRYRSATRPPHRP